MSNLVIGIILFAGTLQAIALLELGFFKESSCSQSPKLLAMQPLKNSNFRLDSCDKAQAAVRCEKQTSYFTTSQYLNVSCRESTRFATADGYYNRFKEAFADTPYFAFTAFNDSKCEKVLLGEAIVLDGTCIPIQNQQSNKAIITSTSVTLKTFTNSQNCSGPSIDTRIDQALYNGTTRCGVVDGLHISAFYSNKKSRRDYKDAHVHDDSTDESSLPGKLLRYAKDLLF